MKCDRESLRLYGISAVDRTTSDDLVCAIDGGITMFQLREKNLSFGPFLRKALDFGRICSDRKIPFIVNDDIEIARLSHADGVHLGQKDGSLAIARKILGQEKIIGVSVHSVEEAQRAENEGADYLGVGALFSTSTKSDAVSVDLSVLRAICSEVKIPVVGIGGIHHENILQLANLGIAGVAIVSAIFGVPDIVESTRKLDQLSRKIIL